MYRNFPKRFGFKQKIHHTTTTSRIENEITTTDTLFLYPNRYSNSVFAFPSAISHISLSESQDRLFNRLPTFAVARTVGYKKNLNQFGNFKSGNLIFNTRSFHTNHSKMVWITNIDNPEVFFSNFFLFVENYENFV